MIGVSPDTAEAQAAFKVKYNLPFTLLADPDHQIAEAFGAWGLREIRGQQVAGGAPDDLHPGPGRQGAAGLPQVTPADHAQELLQALARLGRSWGRQEEAPCGRGRPRVTGSV